MKITFISQNPFGLQGTPGTYKLIESFYRKAFQIVFAAKPTQTNTDIVYHNRNKFPVYEIQFRNKEERQLMIDMVVEFKPDIVYFCSGQLWRVNSGEIIRKIIKKLPLTKFVLDIKSPMLTQVQKLREESSRCQHLLDKIFSRSIEDVEDWIADLKSDVSIYPLGVSINAFSPRKHNDKNVLCKKFVYIGALHQRRQIDKMLNYIADLPKEIKSVFRLDIFGSGPYFDSVRDIIDDKNLHDLIVLRSAIEQSQLLRMLSNYDAGIGWVPYEAYNFAPSLKTLEYLAAGLVPFVSDTTAHQRLSESGFKLAFFSNDKNSFIKTITQLCIDGFPTSDIQKNLELIKNHDWDIVVDDHLFPELENLVANSCPIIELNSKPNIQQALVHDSEENELDNHENGRVLLIYESQTMVTTNILTLVNALEKGGYCIGIGYPSTKNKLTAKELKHCICFPWDTGNVSIEIYRKALLDFKPKLIVLFYCSHDVITYFKAFSNSGIPLIVSERAAPEKVVIPNWANAFQISTSKAIWQREMVLSNASKIHLTHRNYIKSIPDFLHSRTHIFADCSVSCANISNEDTNGGVRNRWMSTITESIRDAEQDTFITSNLKNIDCERVLHAKRMRDKLFSTIPRIIP